MSNQKEIEKALRKLETKGKKLFLAQDQGLEHGPQELGDKAINPEYVFNIAEKGEIDAFICQVGLAEKYSHSFNTNIILKLNGKNLLSPKDDPYSPIICSVRNAVDIDAKAIGFTLFPGSKYFNDSIKDYRKVREEAHDFGMPIATWLYPRGENIQNDVDKDVLAYSARIGLELGSDMLKMKYNGKKEDMEFQVKCADKAEMLMAGGPKAESSKEFLKQIKEVNEAGAKGFAIGRNIWLHEDPIAMTKAIRDVQISGKDIYDALKRFEK